MPPDLCQFGNSHVDTQNCLQFTKMHEPRTSRRAFAKGALQSCPSAGSVGQIGHLRQVWQNKPFFNSSPDRAAPVSLQEVAPSICGTADDIARGERKSAEVLEDFLSRARAAQPKTNAVALWREEEAHREAEQADAAVREGRPLGALHGVPISIKECFDLAGTPSTMGLPSRARLLASQDGEIVRRLKRAGAIVFAKTNVPQLMISHETVNPLYGRSNNPWDPNRTPGGSSGGEAALIASGGSPGGIGSDLGGSIRVPCHFCGITGLKPTSGRLPRDGGIGSMRGLDALVFQPGPMARTVADCGRILEVMCDATNSPPSLLAPPLPLGDWQRIELKGMRIGMFQENGVFPVSAPVKRAVSQAAKHLESQGAEIVAFEPKENIRAFELFLQGLSADGGADHVQFLRGNPREKGVDRLVKLMATPLWIRRLLSLGLSIWGDHTLAKLIVCGGTISTAKYWELTLEIRRLAAETMARFREQGLSALLFPVYGLPAIKHGDSTDALPAASCSIFSNVLGTPCGSVPVTTVQSDEIRLHGRSNDSGLNAANRALSGSAGLPIGLQVMADYWREDIALAVMYAIEAGAISQLGYPHQKA